MTISNADLDSAAAEGLISAETAMALRLHALNRRGPVPAAAPQAEAEHFRLLSGFNDVFVVVALCVLLGALAALATQLANSGVAGFGLTALAAFGLSVYFAHLRRMALPSLALAVWLAASSCAAVAALLLGDDKGGLHGALIQTGWPALALMAAAALHGAVFRVPVNAALLALGLLLLVRMASGPFQVWQPLVLGLVLLAAAVALDAGDRLRRGLRSDAAFWLHLVAAPVLVAGLFGLLTGRAWGRWACTPAWC
jgi:hypothetical protein